MIEKQIVTDPEIAANIQKRLVDPRDIEAIILTTTQDEAPIRGYQPQEVLALSVWADANKMCYAVLQDLQQPAVSIYIGQGTGSEGRTDVSTALIKSLIDRRQNDNPKIIAFIQSKGVSHYPSSRSGPRYFQLVTICRSASAQKHEIRILDKDSILPKYDAAGRQLAEFRIANVD